jgi:hypothetical protein
LLSLDFGLGSVTRYEEIKFPMLVETERFAPVASIHGARFVRALMVFTLILAPCLTRLCLAAFWWLPLCSAKRRSLQQWAQRCSAWWGCHCVLGALIIASSELATVVGFATTALPEDALIVDTKLGEGCFLAVLGALTWLPTLVGTLLYSSV